jgi:hypothetical protein
MRLQTQCGGGLGISWRGEEPASTSCSSTGTRSCTGPSSRRLIEWSACEWSSKDTGGGQVVMQRSGMEMASGEGWGDRRMEWSGLGDTAGHGEYTEFERGDGKVEVGLEADKWFADVSLRLDNR